MREDLELYYKLLKTAMVELINKDYADFVNLSTNLVSRVQTSPDTKYLCDTYKMECISGGCFRNTTCSAADVGKSMVKHV